MSEYAEVREAMKTLRDALNRNGKSIDVCVDKTEVRGMGDPSPKFIYLVSAKVTEEILL